MKEKILRTLTGASLAVLLFTLILHLIGYFTYWESRWHLWVYVPIFILILAMPVWKIACRVPRGTFRAHCRRAVLICCILLLIYMFCFWWINIFTTMGGAGYLDADGIAYLDEYMEKEITGDEYHTLRRAAFQMTTEPMVFCAVFPALFFTTRFRAAHDIPAQSEPVRPRKKNRKGKSRKRR